MTGDTTKGENDMTTKTTADTTIAHYIITDAPGYCGPRGARVHAIVQTREEAEKRVSRNKGLRYHAQHGSEYAWRVGSMIPGLYAY